MGLGAELSYVYKCIDNIIMLCFLFVFCSAPILFFCVNTGIDFHDKFPCYHNGYGSSMLITCLQTCSL